jgi:hypothetical protein
MAGCGGSRARVSRGSVQPFYRRTGGGGGAGRDTTEEGAAGTRTRQGHGVAGVSWLGRRESTASWRVRAGWGRIRGAANHRQQARSVAGRGPLGVAPWHGLPGQASSARWLAVAAPRCDRRGGEERERKAGTQIIFSQNFEQELEKF